MEQGSGTGGLDVSAILLPITYYLFSFSCFVV